MISDTAGSIAIAMLQRTIDEGGTIEIPSLNIKVTGDDKREELAEYAHEAWSGWMRYMFRFCTDNADGTVTMDAEKVARWRRQMETEYADLPEEEKRSDRAEADSILAIINPPPIVEPPF